VAHRQAIYPLYIELKTTDKTSKLWSHCNQFASKKFKIKPAWRVFWSLNYFKSSAPQEREVEPGKLSAAKCREKVLKELTKKSEVGGMSFAILEGKDLFKDSILPLHDLLTKDFRVEDFKLTKEEMELLTPDIFLEVLLPGVVATKSGEKRPSLFDMIEQNKRRKLLPMIPLDKIQVKEEKGGNKGPNNDESDSEEESVNNEKSVDSGEERVDNDKPASKEERVKNDKPKARRRKRK